MAHVHGPDFPTKGIIMGRAGIRSAYATGRGHISVRARAEFEEFAQNRTRIIVTELPYQVNKRLLIAAIAEQVRDKRLEGVSDLRDESDRNGMRIVIELKHDANPQIVLNRLFSQTQMQTTFAVNMLALINNQTQPRILSLRHILDEYIQFQEEVIVRRTKYDLRKALERAHLLEGLIIAQENIDEVIRIIRESYDNAKANLIARFGLSEVQAQAILDMRLKQLQGMDREKLKLEYQELEDRIAAWRALLESDESIRALLKEELIALMNKYGDDRFTEIQDVEDEIDIEDLIEEEACCYTLSNLGYVKRLPLDTYRTQHRGGRGVSAQNLKEEDYVKRLYVASTHDMLLFFTNHGRVHNRKGYRIPEASRTARGTAIVNVLPLNPGETVSAMVLTRDFSEDEYLMMVTRRGTVKRLRLDAIDTIRKTGIRALTLDEGDELISVFKTSGHDKVLLATADGLAICFHETDVRPMGRDATGVRGIRLSKGDIVVGAELVSDDQQLLTVTERGYGKRTELSEYLRLSEDGTRQPQQRGGKGLKNYSITKKTGRVAGVRVVCDDDDVLLIEDGGTIIRTAARDINRYKRDTQGVRIMRISDGSRVIALERAEKEPEQPDEGSEE